MTNSHDTSTPAMSAETVPSEALEEAIRYAEIGEYLYSACAYSSGDGYTEPREYGIEWQWQQSKPDEYGQGMLLAASTAWHKEQADDGNLTEAAKLRATLSASHLAKEGGEAGAVERAAKALYEVRGLHRSTGREWEAAVPADHLYCTRDAEAVIASLPQPSPALAKGGDAADQEADFAAIGRSFMTSFEVVARSEGPYSGYSPAEDPAELVLDLFNDLEETRQKLADAVKALETAREDLGLFRDFVINNATVWASGSNHHHPMWERIARHLEAYQSPTTGDLWKLARSASSQGGE